MTRSDHRSGWRWALALASAGTLAACSDAAPVTSPTPEPALAPAPSTEYLEGRASLEAAASTLDYLEREGRLGEIDPAARDLIRLANRDASPALIPAYLTDGSSTISGPFDINGITFYEEGGEYYPPANRPAVILQQQTTGVLKPGYGEVTAVFQYEGHNATQEIDWRVTDLATGSVIRSMQVKPFGGRKDGFGGWIRYFSGTQKIYDLPKCDITLSAESQHEAWWNGWWEFADEGTASTTGIFGIRIVRQKKDPDYASSALAPAMTLRCWSYIHDDCDSDDDSTDDDDSGTDGLDRSVGGTESGTLRSLSPSGGARSSCSGSGGFDDENACTVCQQWYTIYRSKIVAEWWECHEASADECQELMY